VLSRQCLNSAVREAMSTHESYDPKFFSKLVQIEDEHFWFCARNRIIATLAGQVTQNWSAGYRVLEVGCGTGNVLRTLEEACAAGKVVGMDLFAEGLAFARMRTRCPLVQGSVEQPGFGVQFDLIGAFDVIEHLPDDRRILACIHSMLKPNGVLLLTVPARRALWSYFDEVSHHCRRYEVHDLREKLEDAGYQVEYLSEFMASIYPLVWLVRQIGSWKRRTLTAKSAKGDIALVLQELRIVPVLNGVLEFVLRQEARLIKSRCVLPFGASLVAAARRM
jgi:SAM-dependent methyltransferase